MQFEVNLSLILAIVAIISTIVSMVIFVTKTRWDVGQLEKDLAGLKGDINAIGQKMTEQKILNSDEIRHMLVRIDAVDKAVVSLTVQVGYIADTVKDMKEKLYKSTAIL